MTAPTIVTHTHTHTYAPRGTARQAMQCRAKELLISGPAGTGKSRACLEKVLTMALVTPGMRALIVRKTLVSLGSTTLVTWREHVAREALEARLCVFFGGSAQEPAQFRFTNGSVIVVGGMDRPTKIMGSEYDLVYVAEATELAPEDWDALNSRLRNGRVSFQQLLADCNPDRPTHWLKQRADEGKTTILHSAHWENPRYYAEVNEPIGTPGVEIYDGRAYRLTPDGVDYLGRLDDLSGVRKLRLKDGLWVAADGLVYDNFDPRIHVVPRREIPADWPRFWVIDFGFTNPFVCQFWAEDPDGRLLMYRELYRTQRLVEDHARHALRLVTRIAPRIKVSTEQRQADEADPLTAIAEGRRVWTEPKPTAIICDHDAEDRATFTKHVSLGTVAARKQVTRGVQAVEARLKIPADGRPRLALMSGALVEFDQSLKDAGKPTCTEDEFPSYVWPNGKPGKAEDEHPAKIDDHGMDGVRYMVAHRDLRNRIVSDREVWA